MVARDYTKIAAIGGFLALLLTMTGIIIILNLDKATKYFGITLILIFGVFAYFEYIKDYEQHA